MSEFYGPPEPHAAPSERGGFTIIEFLVVLILVTLTASVSIWAYFARPEITLDNAVQLLVRDMRIAQSRAAILHSTVSVVFREDGDGYRVIDGTDGLVNSTYRPERIDRRFSRDAVFEGVTILPIGLAARGQVLFDGERSDPRSGRITLAYGRATRIVEIEEESGHVLLTGH
jgi:type II secretory pathway pseudopilin PulG